MNFSFIGLQPYEHLVCTGFRPCKYLVCTGFQAYKYVVVPVMKGI